MSESKLRKQSELTVEQSFGVVAQGLDKAAKEGSFGIADAAILNEALETLKSYLSTTKMEDETAKNVESVK